MVSSLQVLWQQFNMHILTPVHATCSAHPNYIDVTTMYCVILTLKYTDYQNHNQKLLWCFISNEVKIAHSLVQVSNLLQSAYTTGQTHPMHLSYATVCPIFSVSWRQTQKEVWEIMCHIVQGEYWARKN